METVIGAILTGIAGLITAIYMKPSKWKKGILCILGFILIGIAAIQYIKSDEESVEPGDTNPPTSSQPLLTPTPAPTSTPTPVPTPAPTPAPTLLDDKITILGVELPPYPCKETVDEYGPGLHYPEKSEYLDEYQIMYIDAPKGHSIYCYSAHGSTKKNLGTILQDEPVIVIANNLNNGFSCVINPETKEAVWVNTNYLVEEPEYIL